MNADWTSADGERYVELRRKWIAHVAGGPVMSPGEGLEYRLLRLRLKRLCVERARNEDLRTVEQMAAEPVPSGGTVVAVVALLMIGVGAGMLLVTLLLVVLT